MKPSMSLGGIAAALVLACGATASFAASPPVPVLAPAPTLKAATAKPAAKPGAPKVAESPYPVVPAGAGYRFAPMPAWVKPAPVATAPASQSPGAKARRDLLADLQVQLGAKGAQSFVRMHSTALDSSTLREVSEPQISFNPAYQTLVIHSVAVQRAGQRTDRLKDARIELMRREQLLERQMIDGVRTALVVLSDVRVGDVVEVAYTLEGENPIFENHYASLFQLAGDAPIDVLQVRIEAPPGRTLNVRAVASDLAPERFEEGGRQVLRLVRQQVPAMQDEAGTPPWFKVYPALHVSEYASWAEVDQWAQRLFADDGAAPAIAEQVALIKAKNLGPEQTVAEALRFVQDEVRYFSVSLGESSHRPKPAARTLAERLGDCKDKVVLLDALLRGLGFDAKPALVSMRRNRGVVNYLPSHDLFDHVISRVTVAGAAYYLDPTINGQGLSLEKRGYFPYGMALVVGGGEDALQKVVPPAVAQNSVHFRQDWDFSDLKQPARLRTSMQTRGLAAERWRAGLANAGLQRVSEAMAGAYVRQLPGLEAAAAPEVVDDREANTLELRMQFIHPTMGRYGRGVLDLELPGNEIGEMLSLPVEARRKAPYQLDLPSLAEQRINVQGLLPFASAPPPPQQVGDKHFSFQTRIETEGARVSFITRYERRGDEVLPQDLEVFRERIARARALTGSRLRLPLVDIKALQPQLIEADKRLVKYRGAQPDALLQILQFNELTRVIDTALLARLDPTAKLAAKVLAERSIANNLLGDFDGGLRDATAALAIQPELSEALDGQGVSLMGLGRIEQALQAYETLAKLPQQARATSWLATAHYYLGHYDKAEQALREQLLNSNGDERLMSLAWVYLAAERQGGRGQQAIQGDLSSVEAGKWPGALLLYLGGKLDRDALLRLARDKPEQERLRLAEAYFFIGQQLAAQGKREQALPWFERVVATNAIPYREMTLARLELQRGARP